MSSEGDGMGGASMVRCVGCRLARARLGCATFVGVMLLVWLALGCVTASAKIIHEKQASFARTGAADFVAVDNATGIDNGDLYVGEISNSFASRVYQTDPGGLPTGVELAASETPAGSFGFVNFSTFNVSSGPAVDGSTGPNAGDVYVPDVAGGVVDRFDATGKYVCQITGSATPPASECAGATGSHTPAGGMEPLSVAVDPSTGALAVGDASGVVYEFNATGEYTGTIADPHITAPFSLAFDTTGSLYVVNAKPLSSGPESAVKFSATGSYLYTLSSVSQSAGVDLSDDHVYLGGNEGEIEEFSSTGSPVSKFGPASSYGSGAFSISVNTATKQVYLARPNAENEIWSGDILIPTVTTGQASEVRETTATLHGEADPEVSEGGSEIVSCRFEYIDAAAYQKAVEENAPNPYASGQTAACSPAAPFSSATAVTAAVTGLSPSAIYHYRVVASNEKGQEGQGEDVTFTTFGPASVGAERATPLTTSATVYAEINPYGYETTCEAQYVDDATFQSSGYAHASAVPCSEALAAGFGGQSVSVRLAGLRIGTGYHYRFIAHNGAASQGGTATGADETFATFGLESFSFEPVDKEGNPYTQAGGHPYALNVRFAMASFIDQKGNRLPDANIKTVKTELPVGFVGNTTATPQCSAQAAERKDCQGSTQVGLLHLYTRRGESHEDPVFNMVPPPGVPAQFVANISNAVNVYIDANVRTGGDYGITTVVHNSSTDEPVGAVWLNMWGVPADESHDSERQCPVEEEPGSHTFAYRTGCSDSEAHKPFLINPSECTGRPQTAKLAVDSWAEPGGFVERSAEVPAVTGCEHLVFQPRLTVQPENQVADSPSGLWVDLKVPQNDAPEGLNSSALKKAVVALPAGVSVSPSAADGLQACSPEEIGLDNAEPARCPDRAKIGTIEITSPLVPYPLRGTVFVAEQGNNPFGSLLAIYVVAHAHGALVKLAGHVELNPLDGQLVTTFDNSPQVPFDDFKLYFFGGPRGPLAMPVSCGTFMTTSDMTPWSAPESGPDALPSDFFTITTGCDKGFAPRFVAGVTDPQAGAHSDFVLSFERSDGEGQPNGLTMDTPPGLVAEVGNVPLCSDHDASAGTCPEGSQIGTVQAATGTGSNPLFVPGKVYLTGPYKGAPYGLAVVVPAVAGPFDLGNVVVRQSLRIDHNDAHVHVVSDPFPLILDGVPLRLRRIDVTLNRPSFMINPTNCEPLSITGTLTSSEGQSANVASRFQLTNCSALGFKPLLKVATTSHTSRSRGTSLNVSLTYPPDSLGKQANIRQVKVELPKQLPSRLETLKQACIDKVFEKDPAACPAASRVGTATASTPIMPVVLSGPAYFVSHGGAEFPELVIVLSGDNITVYLHGETFINEKTGITSSTFHNLPDVPIGAFHLTLPQGRYSALTANTNLCTKKLVMPTSYTAQNGRTLKINTPINVTGCTKHKPHHKHHKKHHKHKHKHKKKHGKK